MQELLLLLGLLLELVQELLPVMNDHGSWLLLPVTVTVTVELGLGTLCKKWGRLEIGNTLDGIP